MKTETTTPKIHERFAKQIEGWLPTLEQRFHATLERVTRELADETYHAPERVMIAVANFIGQVRSSDCIATGDTATFGRCLSELNNSLQPLKYLERPVKRVA